MEAEELSGIQLESIETQGQSFGVRDYICDHFERFLEYAQHLSAFDRQILIEYYRLGKTEEQLVVVHRMSQPTISRSIRRAVEDLGKVIQGERFICGAPRKWKRSYCESPLVGAFSVDLGSAGSEHLFAPCSTPR